MLNLHHLSVFAAVAEAGSVSRGAERLMISQPAVSKQIRLLERAVGGPLFDRHGKGVHLTDAGSVLADYATRIFRLADEAEHALDDLKSSRRGRLAVGAGPTAGIYLLPSVMVRFRQRYPLVRLNAETAIAPVLRQRLLDGLLDMAISETPIVSSELQSSVLVNDVLVPVCGKNSELCSRRKVSRLDFCREPFVMRETISGEKSLVERTLDSRGFGVKPVLTVGSTEAMKQAVIAGLGVAIISRLAIRTEAAAGLLVEIPIAGLHIKYPIHLVRLRGRTLSAAAREFLKMLGHQLHRIDM